jgi:hypothetical protein
MSVRIESCDRLAISAENAALKPIKLKPQLLSRVAWLAALILVLASAPVEGVLFYSTADPNHNTTPPAAHLANSGWDLQGNWGPFLGTPIAARYFITAKHIGGAVGNSFVLDGQDYTTVAFFDDPTSDLRIWKISGSFPAFAALYTRGDETGKNAVVFGRGTQRGDPVDLAGLFGSERKGWRWGVPDGRKRWGENQVAAIVNNEGAVGGGNQDLLRLAFNSGGGANEAHLSDGDSGGAIFINDGTAWKLAGISYVVDGPYSTSPAGPGFLAAVFDEGGLYKGGEGNWRPTPDLFTETPGAFYASRVSSSVPWINSVLSQTSATTAPVLQSSAQVQGPYADETNASVDEGSHTISVTQPSAFRFYRLTGASAFRISGIRINGGRLVMTYE